MKLAARKLSLVDIFDHEGWDEGSVSVPKHSETISAVWSRMSCGNRSLEWRFADQAGRLVVDVAQALDSATSDTVFEFKLFADQRLADTSLGKFSAAAHLETGLTGVNAVRLTVTPAEGTPHCDATAVITNMSVVPGATS